MGRLADSLQTLLHGSPGQRRVMRELRMMKQAQGEWELTFLDLLDKINKQMGKYAKREARELERTTGADAPPVAVIPTDHKADLRSRAFQLQGSKLRTRRIPASVAEPNGDNP